MITDPVYLIGTRDQKWFYVCTYLDGNVTLHEGYDDDDVVSWASALQAQAALELIRENMKACEVEHLLDQPTLTLDEPPELIVLKAVPAFTLTADDQ